MKQIALAILFLISIATTGQENFVLTYGPFLQHLGEDAVTIVWTTNRDAISWVELAPDDGSHFYQKERPKYFSAEFGYKDIGKVHSVRITRLQPATTYRYRVYSQEVLSHHGAAVTYGTVAATNVYREVPLEFTTVDPSKEEVTFLIVNDIHGRNDLLENLLMHGDVKSSDYVFFNGDMANHLTSEENMFGDFMDTAIRLFAKEKPMYYSRGNHETRGHFAKSFPEYFAAPGRKLYYLLRQGPVAFIVLDCGEDKPDSDIEYSGLAAFDAYRDTQKEWLEEIVQTDAYKGADVKVVVIHMPPFGGWHGEEDIAAKFVPVLEEAGVDIMFCGHLHRHIKREGGEAASFPVIVNSNTHVIKARVKGKNLDVDIISDAGEKVHSFSVTGN